jgi:hypothetical protein
VTPSGPRVNQPGVASAQRGRAPRHLDAPGDSGRLAATSPTKQSLHAEVAAAVGVHVLVLWALVRVFQSRNERNEG